MIIDTSALISLYIPEKLSEFVRRKIDEKINTVASHTFYFIDLIYYEFPNVIRKRVVRGEISTALGKEILKKGLEFVQLNKVVEDGEIAEYAYDLSLRYNLTVYDASLIALAIKVKDKVLTTDEKLLNNMKRHKEISSYFVYPEESL